MAGHAVQADGLVGSSQDAGEGEGDAAEPTGADRPRGVGSWGEEVGPGASGGEDVGEKGGLKWCQ